MALRKKECKNGFITCNEQYTLLIWENYYYTEVYGFILGKLSY